MISCVKTEFTPKKLFIQCPIDKSPGHRSLNVNEIPINRAILDILDNEEVTLETLTLEDKRPLSSNSNYSKNLKTIIDIRLANFQSSYSKFAQYFETLETQEKTLKTDVDSFFRQSIDYMESCRDAQLDKISVWFRDMKNNMQSVISQLDSEILELKEKKRNVDLILLEKDIRY